MEERLPFHPKRSFEEKLMALDAIADELPCVVIVLKMPEFSVEYMCRRGLDQLGTTLEKIKALGPDYLYKYFNAEDVDDYAPKLLGLLDKTDENEVRSFFQQVRFVGHPGWHWHLSTVRIFTMDEAGNPTHCIVTAHTVNSIEHINPKVNRLLEENAFRLENRDIFLSLTRREREVLCLLALGKDAREVAAALFISDKTVKTHRKNLRKKLKARSKYDITRFAQAFDLI